MKSNLVDTHCHIHESSYLLDQEEVLQRAAEAGVSKLVCVGTDETTSEEAVRFAQNRDNCWASVGLHPHDAVHGTAGIDKLKSLANEEKVVAVGECGLDYFYEHSPRETQVEMLHAQIELALEHDLPMIFHVREAFDDFWPIFDQYRSAGQQIRGVVHSFTDSQENANKAVERGLYIGVNGISTFTKIDKQTQMYANIPLEKLLLETDAPFLTPTPYRGTVNEPAFVKLVATHLADLRHIPLEELSAVTSQNANTLFRV
jgi:TatD DNase family protein